MISYVIATLGRTEGLEECIQSMTAQTRDDWEAVFVDQNPEGFLPDLEAMDAGGRVRHFIVPWKGVSKARNFGIEEAKGDLIAFLDDDCTIPPDHAERVESFFAQHPDTDLLAGRVLVKGTQKPLLRHQDPKPCRIDLRTVDKVPAACMVFRRRVLEEVGSLDARFGLGEEWGSSAEAEIVIRLLVKGFRVDYEPDIIVYHPEMAFSDSELADRFYRYGRGRGAVMRKHWLAHPLVAWDLVRLLVKPVLAAVLFTVLGRFGRARVQLLSFRGRVEGFLRYKPEER